MSEKSINNTVRNLLFLTVAMFGFGYALVPLYNVFCEVTGLNGKTGQISFENAANTEADKSRTVAVSFDTNIRDMPWEFKANESKVLVHPGELGEATFIVKNTSDREIIGRAIPSVAPTVASVYFNKTECFCFTEQVLAAGETREMKVRFVIDTKIPDRFSTLTLSYTFFAIPEQEGIVKKQEDELKTRI
jgi:cytochrome c oxidase assembly protein subunit 11